MRANAWQMVEVGKPMQRTSVEIPDPGPDEVVVRVAACGVCHTDLGFLYDGVRTVKPLPLTLGHEISGWVEDTGSDSAKWLKKAVVIPAVMPCGECDLCVRGKGTICRKQRMPGNHIDGGFSSHVTVPARYLCPVEVQDSGSPFGESGVTLRELSVVADAVTTPFQAIRNAGLRDGDLAVFVGIGGIGGYGVQIAREFGATVIAIDVDEEKLSRYTDYGAALTFNPKKVDPKAIRKAVQQFARDNDIPPYEWKIFETSGTKAGQALAYGLMTFGATLSVVGFTMDTVDLRLSNLMAFDARAIGNWGCLPEYYPEALDLVRKGRIKLGPFVQTFPMSEINEVFEKVHKREITKRPVMIPDFD